MNRYEGLETYIGYCCREWVLVKEMPTRPCGYCQQRPTYHREDTDRAE